MKSVPGNPWASAVRLYFSYSQDDNDKFVSVYERIKIMSETALRPGGPADVEIPLRPGESLKELKARTIHPDGSIVDFTGKPFEKTVFKTRGVKLAIRTFTLPDVTSGSIVEWSYVVRLLPHAVRAISEWPIQGDLYTLKEHFRFRAFQGVVDVPSEWGSLVQRSTVSYTALNMPGALPQKKKGNVMELELENVPAFDAEDYMPPEDDYKPAVLFYYGGRETASPDKFWDEWQKLIAEYVVKFIGNSGAVREAVAQAVGGETDPEKKLRKLYARAQQIRNLSYERERTLEEEKSEHLKNNASAQDVLQHGYGTGWEIDGLFVAMARAAGFDASMIGVSDRHERSFTKIVLSLDQVGGRAVLVKLNDQNLVLDPGTRFCPYGMLRWKYTASTALNFKVGGGVITTPEPSSSLLHRLAKLALGSDGSAKGEITVELKGQEALEHRLEALQTDEAGRRESWENEVSAWLPAGAVVKMTDSQGWESTDDPLVARFDVAIPTFASVAGKRLVAPAYSLPTLQKNMFTPDSRRYPIVFSYPFSEMDQITLQLPAGYTMEAAPFSRKAGLPYAAYEISSSVDPKQVVTQRTLRFDGLTFPPEKYFELRNFFSIVQAGDDGHAVLKMEQSSTPRDPN
jgi:Transglutaminase-like superfamily